MSVSCMSFTYVSVFIFCYFISSFICILLIIFSLLFTDFVFIFVFFLSFYVFLCESVLHKSLALIKLINLLLLYCCIYM